MGGSMGPQSQTFNNNTATNQAFQEMLYNNVLGLQTPNMTPNYASNPMFSPSMAGRRMAGGLSYTPFIGRPEEGFDNRGLPIPSERRTGLAGRSPSSFNPRNLPGIDSFTGAANGLPDGLSFGGPMAYAESDPRTGVLNKPAGQNPTPGNPNGTYLNGRPIPSPRNFGGEQDRYFYPNSNVPRIGAPRTDYGQQMLDMMQGIFAGLPGAPPGVAIGDLPNYDTAFASPASMDAATLGGDEEIRKLLAMITGSANSGIGSTFGDFYGGDITAPTISREGTSTQSADEITRSVMGGNSMFTNNILPAYNDLFNTQNRLTAAAAREASGNLTGSGYANTIGTALNRNNSTQQALLANVLQNLTGQEIGRQGAGAGLAAQRNIAQGGMELQASTTSAQLRQAAKEMAQRAQQSGRADLMQAANLLNQRAAQQAMFEQQANMTNAGFAQEGSIFNAGQENAANSQYFNAGVNRNQRQAEIDAQRQGQLFGAASDMSNQNAQRMMQLLMQLFQGGQPTTTQTSAGAGAAIPGLMQLIPIIMGMI